MDISGQILYYILVYEGRKTGIIKRVMEDFHCEELEVLKQIDLLISAGKIRILPYEEMSEHEKYEFDRNKEKFYQIVKK